MFEGYIAGKFANKMFEKDVFKTIKIHALIGSIILMIPDFGLGTLWFIGILWHMYSSICDKVGISFSKHFWSLVGVGIFVNVVIAFAIDVIFTVLFYLEGFLIYFQFYLSGKLFVESIKRLDIKDEELQHITSNKQQNSIAPHPSRALGQTEEQIDASANNHQNIKRISELDTASAQDEIKIQGKKLSTSQSTVTTPPEVVLLPQEKELESPPKDETLQQTIKTEGRNSIMANYRYPIEVAAVILGVVFIYLLLNNVKSDTPTEQINYISQVSQDPIIETGLKGTIDGHIGFSMHLTQEKAIGSVEGYEHYDSQKDEARIIIKGTIDEQHTMILDEYDGNTRVGTFNGVLRGDSYSGRFTNSKGKTMPFTAAILTFEELANMEKEEKMFKVARFEYKNHDNGAFVDLAVDYPTYGNEQLLQKTREYICGVIAAMFHINEYKGNLADGSCIVNGYGKSKHDALRKEREVDEYRGSDEYEETISFTKDFENNYCVSYCANYFYYHGGVGNSFCDASTFRKVDGKQISIIKSKKDKGLHNLIIAAVKNKLGEHYESIDEGFESSPVAGIIHLTKEGVQFDYQHYEIGPGAFGQISVIVPYEKMKPYMTEMAKNVIEN